MSKLSLAILITLIASMVVGGEKAPPTERELKVLVEQLVSPNLVTPTDECWPEYPPNFDRTAQERVLGAMKRLRNIGLPAFPYLIARISDKRYSLTEDAGSCDFAFSVGTICYLMVDAHLHPYGHYTNGEGDPRERDRRPNYIDEHKLTDPKGFQAWWKTHKAKSMRDIQIEVLDWTISEEEKRPKDFSIEERRYLKAILAKLRQSGDPLPPRWPFAK
jgi:hypothetical protein